MKKPIFLLVSVLIMISLVGVVYRFYTQRQPDLPAAIPLSAAPTSALPVPDTIYVGGNSAEIHPPISGLDIKYRSFRIRGDKAHLLRLPSGTEIKIPANAFINKEGKPVKEIFTLKYREFHDAADIFVSGIPMEIKSGDKIRHLTTAGMFDIRAENQDGGLSVKNGKKLSVTMISRTPGNDYDAYYFAENKEGWIRTGKSKTMTGPELKQIRQVKEEVSEEMIRIPLGEEYFAMNYNSLLDVMVDANWTGTNKMDNTAAVEAKAKAYGFHWYGIWSGEVVEFGGNQYPAALMLWKYHEGVRFPDWASIQEAYVKVTPTAESGVYHLVINTGERYFDVYAEAVMPLKSLFAYPAEFWKNNYEEAMTNILNEEIRIRNEAKILRNMEVFQMGVYNFDKIMKDEGALIVKANFSFPQNMKNGFSPQTVYYIPEDNRSVIKLPKNDWESVAVFRGKGGKIISVLPDQSIGFYSGNRYKKIPFDSIQRLSEPVYEFVLAATPRKATALSDVKELLGL